MKRLMQSAALLAFLLGFSAGGPALAGDMGTVKIDLPPEHAQFKPGPGMETAAKYCMICHSVDYVYMQPPLTREQWHGEVMKMKKVFGCPLPDGDVDTIVDYLMSQNGKK